MAAATAIHCMDLTCGLFIACAASPIRYAIIQSRAPRFKDSSSEVPFGAYNTDTAHKKSLESHCRGATPAGCGHLIQQKGQGNNGFRCCSGKDTCAPKVGMMLTAVMRLLCDRQPAVLCKFF